MPSVTLLVRDVAAKARPVVTARPQKGWQWAAAQFGNAQQWPSGRKQAAFVAAGVLVVVLLLIFSGVTAAVAAVAAWVALLRHFAQTEADRQRRITESFSKAIEQLGSDKLEVRLGGVYTLERISQESPQDYWTVMENLTAFVRERTRRTEAERTAKPGERRIAERAYRMWENAGRPEGRSDEFWREAAEQEPPEADIEAALTVIKRRTEKHRDFELKEGRILDLRLAVLRHANLGKANLILADLAGAHLERAELGAAHLERANLHETHLEGARLFEAYLQGTHLGQAHLEGARLSGAHLERAYLGGAHLEGAYFHLAHLEGAYLRGAHLQDADLYMANLEGACLDEAHGLTQAQIDAAEGNAETELPAGLTRPEHWTQPEHGAESAA